MNHPMLLGNYALIGLGVLLIVGGPYIVYRTVVGWREKAIQEPDAPKQWFSHGLNFLIALLFFVGGILFVLNNLKGNPLA